MKKRRLLVVACLILTASIVAIAAKYIMPFDKEPVLPAAKDELSALAQHWLSLQEYNISGVIRLYDSKDSNTVKEQTSFSMYKKSKSFYTVLGSIQTMCDGNILVQIDTVNRYLIIAPVSDSMYTASTNSILPLQKMLEDTSGFRITAAIKGNDAQRTLTIADEHTPEIKKVHVAYQVKDYRINNVIVEWWKNTSIADATETWLTKMNYDYNVKPAVNVEEKIQSVINIEKNGTVTVKEQYRDYLLQKEI